MATPRATILVPSYNHGSFVLDAVTSALAQTERDVEVLVIDDGSTDDSVARVRSVSDPRLVVHVQDNAGLSRTLNRGLALARAPWVKFLPSDDALAPEAIERQLAAATPGIGVVFSLPEVVDARGAPLADPAPQAWFDHPARTRDEILRGLVERNFLCAPGALFDRRLALAVGGFDETLVVAQDYDLWLKLLERTDAGFVAERLVRVRWHGANQSAVATAATEAERARVVAGTLVRIGIEGWIELFRAGLPHGAPRDAARRALAAALVRAGLASLPPEAARLIEEVRSAPEDVPRAGPRRAVLALRRLLGTRAPRARRGEAESVAPLRREIAVAPGPRAERWLVVEPTEPPSLVDAARRLAAALAATGAAAIRLTRRPGAPDPSAGAVETAAFDLRVLRALLREHDERLRVVVLAPDAEAVAFAREARLRGARVLYDKLAQAQGIPSRAVLDTEQAMVDAADDLIGADRTIVKQLAASRRLVHLLPVEGDGFGAHAVSLTRIVARPTVAVLVACGEVHGYAAVRACVDGLLGARAGVPYRVAAIDEGAPPDVLADLEARDEAGTILLLRSPRSGRAAGANLALRATASELVVLLDASWRASGAAWLEGGVAALLADRTAGAVVARPPGADAWAWLAPRAALARAGGFDESCPGDASADGDLERRLAALGYAVRTWPDPAPRKV